MGRLIMAVCACFMLLCCLAPPAAAQSQGTVLHPECRKLFFIDLTLRASNAPAEEDQLVALGEVARAVDGILLVVPSYYEFPDAPSHPLVQRFVTACALHGLDVYWGRQLWVTWPELSPDYVQQADDVFNPAYYAAYLSRLHVEAGMLGAAGTMVYGEPHGDSIYRKAWFKRTGFADAERDHIETAIDEALCYAPRASLVYPCGYSHTNTYGWSLRHLAAQLLHSRTYQVRNLARLPATAAPEPLRFDWLGTWITMHPEEYPKGSVPLTIAEWSALDVGAALAQRPELAQGGLWIYVHSANGERVEAMYALSAAAQAQKKKE